MTAMLRVEENAAGGDFLMINIRELIFPRKQKVVENASFMVIL